MAGFSGKDGTAKHGATGATAMVELTGWTFSATAAVPKWASNDSNGFKKGVAGIEDSKGTMSCKLDYNGQIPFKPGDSAFLYLHADKTGQHYIRVAVVIQEMPIEVKIDPDGDAPTVEYNWEGVAPPAYTGLFSKTASSSGVE